MEPSLQRNPTRVQKAVYVDKETNVWVAKEEIKILFPKSYLNGKLGSLDERVNVIGYYAVVVGGNYSVSKVAAITPFTPDNVSVVKFDESDYYQLTWQPGSIICPNCRLVREDKYCYELFNEIVAKGKTPWYLNRTDLAFLFDSFKKFAGANLGADHAILEIFQASRIRNPKDRTQQLREVYKTQDEFVTIPGDIIPQRSIAYGANNTTAKLMGSYLREGISSALVNPAQASERVEELLRA